MFVDIDFHLLQGMVSKWISVCLCRPLDLQDVSAFRDSINFRYGNVSRENVSTLGGVPPPHAQNNPVYSSCMVVQISGTPPRVRHMLPFILENIHGFYNVIVCTIQTHQVVWCSTQIADNLFTIELLIELIMCSQVKPWRTVNIAYSREK